MRNGSVSRRRTIPLWVLVLLVVNVGAVELPDPMRPLQQSKPIVATEPVDYGTFELRATKIMPAHRTAMINGQVVGVGETIDGATVLKIESKEVVIEYQDKEIILRLLKHDVKRLLSRNRWQ